ERREAGPTLLLQVVTAQMEVAGPSQEAIRDIVDVERADRPEGGQDRAIAAAAENDGRAGRQRGVDRAGRHVDAARGHCLEHELPEGIVADDTDERDPEPETSGAAGEDGRRAS